MTEPDPAMTGRDGAPAPTDACARARAGLAELVCGAAPAGDLAAHAAGCAGCAALLEGAGAVRAGLDAWRAPPPPDDLVERALARAALAALAGPAAAGPGGPAPLPLPTPAPPPRRRSSVELLTSAPFEGGVVVPFPPSRRQLLLRLASQAAAAVLLFAASTGFAVAFYPALTHALDEGRVRRCQDHLRRLAAAAARYRLEHAAGPELRGGELRRALVEGGYVDPAVLSCPGPRGHDLGENSYVGVLPASDPGAPGRVPAGVPLFWDRFGNHADGIVVVDASGRARLLGVEDLDAWLPRRDGAGE